MVDGNSDWHAGQSRAVWQGKSQRVVMTEYGRDSGGLLRLRMVNGKTSVSVQRGRLDPMEECWVWTLNRAEYAAWVERAKGVK